MNRYQQATPTQRYGFPKESLIYTVVALFESISIAVFGARKVTIDYFYEQTLLTWRL